MVYAKQVQIDALKGKTFVSVTETDATVTFHGTPSFRLEHQQDCCESVWLEDVTGATGASTPRGRSTVRSAWTRDRKDRKAGGK